MPSLSSYSTSGTTSGDGAIYFNTTKKLTQTWPTDKSLSVRCPADYPIQQQYIFVTDAKINSAGFNWYSYGVGQYKGVPANVTSLGNNIYFVQGQYTFDTATDLVYMDQTFNLSGGTFAQFKFPKVEILTPEG